MGILHTLHFQVEVAAKHSGPSTEEQASRASEGPHRSAVHTPTGLPSAGRDVLLSPGPTVLSVRSASTPLSLALSPGQHIQGIITTGAHGERQETALCAEQLPFPLALPAAAPEGGCAAVYMPSTPVPPSEGRRALGGISPVLNKPPGPSGAETARLWPMAGSGPLPVL